MHHRIDTTYPLSLLPKCYPRARLRLHNMNADTSPTALSLRLNGLVNDAERWGTDADMGEIGRWALGVMEDLSIARTPNTSLPYRERLRELATQHRIADPNLRTRP